MTDGPTHTTSIEPHINYLLKGPEPKSCQLCSSHYTEVRYHDNYAGPTINIFVQSMCTEPTILESNGI